MNSLEDFYLFYKDCLKLRLISNPDKLKRSIHKPELHVPGLSLIGYLKGYPQKAFLAFSHLEIDYLKTISKEQRLACLKAIITNKTPAVFIMQHPYLKDLVEHCESISIPLFCVSLSFPIFIKKLTHIFEEKCSPKMTVHGTLVEVFDRGVLIQGEPGVGKSTLALKLIERGHRLISDDIVSLTRIDSSLQGSSLIKTQHLLEMKGVGIINIVELYGILRVRESKNIHLVIQLQKECLTEGKENPPFKRFLGVSIPSKVISASHYQESILLIEASIMMQHLKEQKKSSD